MVEYGQIRCCLAKIRISAFDNYGITLHHNIISIRSKFQGNRIKR